MSDTLPRHPRPGVEEWVNPHNGLTVIRLHYTADPRKRTPEWKAQASANMHPRAWRREYEIDWAAPAGDPVIPEYQDEIHTQEFAWDRTLRLLRFWDFGYVSPVTLFAQLTLFGQLRIRRELCPFNTPLDQLFEGMIAVTAELGGMDPFARLDAWDASGEDPAKAFDAGDPASTNQTDLGSSAEVLGNKGIVLHTTRPGTEVSYANLRSRFLRRVMEPNKGQVPAIIIHPDCKNLRAALAGAFSLSPLPPYRPVKSHPEKDLVDALRYGEDNLRALAGESVGTWRAVAHADERTLRSAPVRGDDEWQTKQAEKWRQIVEEM